MTAALIILAALIVVGLMLYLTDRPAKAETSEGEPTPVQSESGCCGLHLVCEKDSLTVSIGEEIEYYDDEELDAYKGVSRDDYSEEAIEQFREVLVTLLPADIAGWARSIQMRGIELPAIIRDELLMMVAEARQQTA